MKVVGLSFIRNAILYDYPIAEAVRSILPLCDEVVVAVGKGEDNTRELVQSLDPKVRIIDTVWNEQLRQGGAVLADETNKALDAVPADADWVVYIQGDEVLHEQYIPTLINEMQRWKDDPKTEGLVVGYQHFYGAYNLVGASRKWYRREVRIIRRRPEIRSFRDAQGFRKNGNQKIRARLTSAYYYHYGWVKNPYFQQQKSLDFSKYWHSDDWIEQNVVQADAFDYQAFEYLTPFIGTHPSVMAERIARCNWQFDYDPNKATISLKDRLLLALERKTGYRLGEYRNYTLL